MKRELRKLENKNGYKFPLEDVYEVVYAKDTKYHKMGEKDLVSLPLAIMFINDGRILETSEIKEAILKYQMSDLLNSNKKSK